MQRTASAERPRAQWSAAPDRASRLANALPWPSSLCSRASSWQQAQLLRLKPGQFDHLFGLGALLIEKLLQFGGAIADHHLRAAIRIILLHLRVLEDFGKNRNQLVQDR